MPVTIQDLFSKARHPDRVVVGVCFQVAKQDADNFLINLDKWSKQIRTYFLKHDEAKGPCFARALIQQNLFCGEDYYFQIDSHFRFVDGWDALCIEQLARCQSPRPVLTTYASSYTLPNDYVPGEPDRANLAINKAITILCADTFGDQNQDDPFLRIKTRTARSDFGGIPPPALLWTARFAFSRGSVVRAVPYDPSLEYLFFGEEIVMAVRLWTSGWDLFSPTCTIAYHLGSRAHRPWFREVQITPDHVHRETEAKRRVAAMLGHKWFPQTNGIGTVPTLASPYGLGKVRSLEEYERFAGLSFRDGVIHERAKCGGLPADLFGPQWAEEERDKVMQANQLRDTASWAGKGNDNATYKQSPVASTAVGCGEKGTGKSLYRSNPDVQRGLEAARVRIHMLQARLQVARQPSQNDMEGSDTVAAIDLELSRAFLVLGKMESADGDQKQAKDAYLRTLQHAQSVHQGNPPPSCGGKDDAFRAASAYYLEGSARFGLEQHAEAKAALKESLDFVCTALNEHSTNKLEVLDQLAYEILEAVHSVHETTDDRQGLQCYISGIQTLLKVLQRKSGEVVMPLPVLSSSQRPPDDVETNLRARLLERAALLCIATGRDKEFDIVRSIFTGFSAARESANMLRLLGMLQSSGHLL